MKLGIVIGLGEMDRLAKQFIAENETTLGQQLFLSHFLLWLKQLKENEANGKTKDVSISTSNRLM